MDALALLMSIVWERLDERQMPAREREIKPPTHDGSDRDLELRTSEVSPIVYEVQSPIRHRGAHRRAV